MCQAIAEYDIQCMSIWHRMLHSDDVPVLFQLWFSVTVSVTVILFQFQLFFRLILQLFDISVTVTVILNINKLDTKHAKYCIQLTSCRIHTSAIGSSSMVVCISR